MVWYSHLFQNFSQLIVIHTVKGFGIVNKADIDAAAKRSYPTSEVRGSGQEYQTAKAQERRRGATLRPRSEAAKRGVTLCPEARGGW